MEGGASGAGEGYMPSPEFMEDAKEALIDLDTSDSTELWLMPWPSDMPVDFDGQELTLKLHRDGKLGTFEGSSGKEYDVVSYAAQKPTQPFSCPLPQVQESLGRFQEECPWSTTQILMSWRNSNPII